jgi:hypothetical protein
MSLILLFFGVFHGPFDRTDRFFSTAGAAYRSVGDFGCGKRGAERFGEGER